MTLDLLNRVHDILSAKSQRKRTPQGRSGEAKTSHRGEFDFDGRQVVTGSFLFIHLDTP